MRRIQDINRAISEKRDYVLYRLRELQRESEIDYHVSLRIGFGLDYEISLKVDRIRAQIMMGTIQYNEKS